MKRIIFVTLAFSFLYSLDSGAATNPLKTCWQLLIEREGSRAAELRARINSGEFFDFDEFYRRYPRVTRDPLSQGIANGQKYFTVEMDAEYKGEQISYAGWLLRAFYRLTFRDGLICDWRGRPMNGFIHYVMDGSGTFYGGWVRRHSVFLAARSVASAGHMWVDNGKLMWIARQSGHYKPSRELYVQALLELRENKIDLSDVKLRGFDLDSGSRAGRVAP